MDLWSLLGISGPVFYIIGLVVFIRWLMRGGRSAERDATVKAAARVRQAAAFASPEAAQILLEAAGRIDGNIVLGASNVVPAAVPVASSVPAAAVATPSRGVNAGAVSGWHEPSAAHPAGLNAAVSPTLPAHSVDPMHSLDNINVLLYLGAFLVVVSAGIFVGYNFSALSGGFKTIFLALFALAFYGVGLVLFMHFKKLRPAGVTFTGIGLVMLPLVGLAAYNFTSLHDHGAATWFATSLITLIAYGYTLVRTHQTYVAYLMTFTTLSLFESSISLFNLPVYWFGWAMAIVAILLLSLSRFKGMWQDTAAALKISANVFLPISLILSAYAIEPQGWAQLGVTLGLAGIFYAAMASRSENLPEGEGYWVLALLSLPAALTTGLWDSLPRLSLAAVLLAVGGVYLVALHMVGKRLNTRWLALMALVTGILPFGGLALAVHRPWAVAACLAAAVLINAELALKLRQTALAMLASLSLIALPFVVLRLCLEPAQPWSAVAASLLAVAAILVWWAHRLKDWPESGAAVGILGYLLPIGLAIWVALPDPGVLLWVSLAAAGGLYGLSYTERRSEFVYLAVAALYLALFQPAGLLGWESQSTALLLLLAGLVLYGLGWLSPEPEHGKALRYSALVGPFLGAATAVADTGIFDHRHNLLPVLSWAGGGALLLIEARRQGQQILQEVAGGILILAVNWYCATLEIDQTQAYSLPWAAYLAFLAWRRRNGGHDTYDGLTGAALLVLTMPLAGQALASDGQLYGLALIVEAIALVFVGMAMRYKLVTIWGAATLVVEVLYQMRDFFYALPKYFISAALGLALLAVAIVLLQRRKGGE